MRTGPARKSPTQGSRSGCNNASLAPWCRRRRRSRSVRLWCKSQARQDQNPGKGWGRCVAAPAPNFCADFVIFGRLAFSRSVTLQPMSRAWLRYCCGFDLDQNVRMIKACDTEKRAYLTAPGPFEAVFNLGRPRLQGAIDVRGVEVQTDHIRHLEPGILQNRFQVIQALRYLGAHVPRMERVSFSVNGDLSGAIEDALRVADLVGLDEPVGVLPPPGVDDSPICCHICLLLPPLFPGGLWLHRCIVEPREVQHMSQTYYFLPSQRVLGPKARE